MEALLHISYNANTGFKIDLSLNNIRKTDLVSQGLNYKILVAKKVLTTNGRLYAKILLPKHAIDLAKGQAISFNNIILSKSKGIISVRYQNGMSLDSVQQKGSSYVFRVSDRNFAMEYIIPEHEYRELKGERKQLIHKKINSNLNEGKSNEINSNKTDLPKKEEPKHKPIPKKPVVRMARDTAFKRCGHCINLRSDNVCRKHDRMVSVDQVCSLFYTPRVYLGGTMSKK